MTRRRKHPDDRRSALHLTEATDQGRSLSAAQVKVILDRFHREPHASRQGPAKLGDKRD